MFKNSNLLSPDSGITHLLLSAIAVLLATLALLLVWPRTAESQRSPLDSVARLAISRNLAVRQAREVERQGQFGVRQAQGLFLPTLSVDARYSEMSGAIDLGDVINPAYAALNQIIGNDRFPTNIHQTLPYKQETKLRSTLPLFNGALFANLAAARAIRDLRGAELAAATRRLDADARVAYLNYARAARAVDIYDAALRVVNENQRVAERLVGAGTATATRSIAPAPPWPMCSSSAPTLRACATQRSARSTFCSIATRPRRWRCSTRPNSPNCVH